MKFMLKIAALPVTVACLAVANPAYAGEATNTVALALEVQPGCRLDTEPLMFGNANFFTGQIDATSTIDVRCNPGTAYTVAVDNGDNALNSQRRMVSTSAFLGLFRYVNYQIYRNPGRNQVWGSNPGHVVSGVIPASGHATHTMYGRVPNTIAWSVEYRDTVTVTLTF
ncbi:spore coat protein U domain-containing protein [Tsuneonella flava]|uniref:Spore coat protein U domain-containing protein n=2 Tax=Tsuneonella flava TaxID=2055955 RepID=A0ABX7KD24_9SPHN|nr:spore coat protein U domain-containing protein [Tsuneonella flava]